MVQEKKIVPGQNGVSQAGQELVRSRSGVGQESARSRSGVSQESVRSQLGFSQDSARGPLGAHFIPPNDHVGAQTSP